MEEGYYEEYIDCGELVRKWRRGTPVKRTHKGEYVAYINVCCRYNFTASNQDEAERKAYELIERYGKKVVSFLAYNDIDVDFVSPVMRDQNGELDELDEDWEPTVLPEEV